MQRLLNTGQGNAAAERMAAVLQRLINAGQGNMMAADKIVAIISPNSAPAKRLKDEAREAGRLVDITQGRKTRSLVITTANQVFLSPVEVKTLAARVQPEPGRLAPDEPEAL